jgi:hypothetical protein
LKLFHGQHNVFRQSGPNLAFDFIRLMFKTVDFLPMRFKYFTPVRHITFRSLLKSPGTFLYFFSMLLKRIKRRFNKH